MALITENSIPVLKSGQDMSKLQLSPQAAFVLSRLDGTTTIAVIGFMSGIEVEEVIGLLAPLVQQGVVEVKASGQKEKKEVGSILDLLDQEDSDTRYANLAREFRREVLLVFSRLGEMDHFELLELKRGSNAAKVKAAYFNRSKHFHPDRYFSQDIGHYKKKITKIYEKVNVAYQVLTDEKQRKQYLSTLNELEGKETLKLGLADSKNKQSVEGMNRARRYFEWGKEDYVKSNYASAATNFKLALTFDATNEEYQKAYDRVAPFVKRKKSKELVEKAQESWEAMEYGQAYEFYRQALENSPQEGNILLKLSRLTLIANVDVGQCAEYNKRAKAILGETAYGWMNHGLWLEKKRDYQGALASYQRASDIDPADKDVKQAIKRAKKHVRDK